MGGQWEGNERSGFSCAPVFKCYISLCLEKGIRVAVATILNRDRLRRFWKAIPHSRARDTVVFGGDDHVRILEGKQSQLFLAMDTQQASSAISRGRPTVYSPRVLMNDHPENINVAYKRWIQDYSIHPESSPKTFLHAPII
jgi:hypothetical protein